MSDVCRRGEICKGTGIRGGRLCTCHILKKAHTRFIAAGFPSQYADLTADKALELTGRPANLKDRLLQCGRAMTMNPKKLLVVRPSMKGSYPIACWAAKQMALKRDIYTTNIGSVITDLFNRGTVERQLKTNRFGLVIRLGFDTRDHKFVPTKLIEILVSRLDIGAPTVVCFDASPGYNYRIVYGEEALNLIDGRGISI